MEKNFQISPNCTLFAEGANNEKIIIKNNVALNYNVMINANNKGNIQIGNDVIIGPNVVLRASNHIYKDKSVNQLDINHMMEVKLKLRMMYGLVQML